MTPSPTRIAVLGANGQVGAELCLLLAQQPGVEVIPICRNRQGSAYLRWRGLACRHGRIEDLASARALLGDCRLVANLALIPTVADPRGARAANAHLIDRIARAAMPGARHLYFSTMSVYGDREVGQRYAVPGAYGAEKQRCERLALRAGRRAGIATHVFRLGHVCGELQGISAQMRALLVRGTVRLADPARASNTTQVAAICDAILKVADDAVPPGTYDLMNTPQWSWREAFEHEARASGLPPPAFEVVPETAPSTSVRAWLRRLIGGLVLNATGSPPLKRWLSRAMPLLPGPQYRRLKAHYAVRAAAAEIAGLRQRAPVLEATRRVPIAAHAAPALTRTAELLSRPEYRLPAETTAASWPTDLAHTDPRA